MNVDVQFTTQLRAALGRSHEQLTVDSQTTVAQLLKLLAAQHSQAFQQFVFSADGELLPNILVCVADQQVTKLEDHVLRDGDTVTLLSAISGG